MKEFDIVFKDGSDIYLECFEFEVLDEWLRCDHSYFKLEEIDGYTEIGPLDEI
jgi:hypothetical protein